MQLPHNKSGGNNEKEGPNEIIAGNEFQSGASAAPSGEHDFSEFMWMANEDLDDFDRKVISEFDEQFGLDAVTTTIGEEEEEFLQKMLEEEEERDTVYFLPQHRRADQTVVDLSNRMHSMNVSGRGRGIAAQSILNPLAAEFVPGQGFQEPTAVAAAAAALHAPVVPHPTENPLYCSSVQGAGLNSLSTCLQSQNIIINSNSQQHILQQQEQHQHQQQQQQQPPPQQRFISPGRAHLNGHNPVASVSDAAAVRRFFPGVNVPQTVYVSNMPGVYPLMNGSQFIQAPAPTHSHLQHQQAHQQQSQYPNAEVVVERSNTEDEGQKKVKADIKV